MFQIKSLGLETILQKCDKCECKHQTVGSPHHETKRVQGRAAGPGERAGPMMLGQTTAVWQKPESRLRRPLRGRWFPGRRPQRCPGRTMVYSVSKNLDNREEKFREFTSKKSGYYDGGRARAEEPSGYERTDKTTKQKTTLTKSCS